MSEPPGTIRGCRACTSSDLVTFLSLGNLPLADGLLAESELDQPEAKHPLDIALCERCSLVQLRETVSPELLFCRDYPYYSSFSTTLLDHARRSAESLVRAQNLGSGSLVIELASNDGYLLQFFREAGVPVLGIDPAEGPARTAVARGIPTRCEFFTGELAAELAREGRRADVVIANNVLAHVPDPRRFLDGVRLLLKDTGLAVVEVGYVRDLVRKGAFDTIYHEHLCYFSATALDHLCRQSGLFLNGVERIPLQGGSLRGFLGKQNRPTASTSEFLAREKAEGLADRSYYDRFASRIEEVKDALIAELKTIRSRGETLAAYGAAAKGAVLLNYAGIGLDLIDFVVDRNVHKQGRFMPGVRIPIHSPTRILEQMPDYVLLLPWNLKDEILEQEREYRNRGGKFIVPLPSLEIL